MDRRKFVTGAAAGALGSTLLGHGMQREAAAQDRASAVAPSDVVGLGIIGPGSRGQELMRHFLRVRPNVSAPVADRAASAPSPATNWRRESLSGISPPAV